MPGIRSSIKALESEINYNKKPVAARAAGLLRLNRSSLKSAVPAAPPAGTITLTNSEPGVGGICS